ncbi:nuclear transport factor 2 family protein [Sciscionella marina]|uniref:nuclear transport factor 2 family protein n=1 Tax=Sciscionella marina TaxID=508770 RepID=UPI0003811705|nr:nuclear transport factor 2 family protein [Sciscionella marina]
MPSADTIKASVRDYLDAVANGTSADIAAHYTENATLEDPVGSPEYQGRAVIQEFYSTIAGTRRQTELLAIRVADNSAAFHFRIRTETPDGTSEIEPIDVMTFDEDGHITGMRAYWSPDDLRTLP